MDGILGYRIFPVKFRDRVTGAIKPPAASLRVSRFSHLSRYEESVRYLGNVASADAVGGGPSAYIPNMRAASAAATSA